MSAYRLSNWNKMDNQKTLPAINKVNEYHREQRLNYNWPMWFSKKPEKRFTDAKCFEGQMVNISSVGVIFRCGVEENNLHVGQRIKMRFRVPRFGWFEPFSILLTTHTGRICRVYDVNNLWRQIAIKFEEPLFFKPGEQGLTESEVRQKLEGVEI